MTQQPVCPSSAVAWCLSLLVTQHTASLSLICCSLASLSLQVTQQPVCPSSAVAWPLSCGDSAASLSLICCSLASLSFGDSAATSSAVAWPLSLSLSSCGDSATSLSLLVLSFAATSRCSADSAATLNRQDVQSAKICTQSQTALTGTIEHYKLSSPCRRVRPLYIIYGAARG